MIFQVPRLIATGPEPGGETETGAEARAETEARAEAEAGTEAGTGTEAEAETDDSEVLVTSDEGGSEEDEDENNRRALLLVPQVVGAVVGAQYCPHIRNAMVSRLGAEGDGLSPELLRSECHRYYHRFRGRLPHGLIQRAVHVRDAVARSYRIAHDVVYPYALATVSGSSTVPPQDAVQHFEASVLAGATSDAAADDDWVKTAPECTILELRDALVEASEEESRQVMIDVETVERVGTVSQLVG